MEYEVDQLEDRNSDLADDKNTLLNEIDDLETQINELTNENVSNDSSDASSSSNSINSGDASDFLKISDDYGYLDQWDNFVVFGKLENIGYKNIQDIDIELRCYDEDDNLLGFTNDPFYRTWFKIISAGSVHYFRIIKDVDAHRYELTVSGTFTNKEPLTHYEVSDVNLFTDDLEHTITGYITNHESTEESFETIVVYFDSNDKMIGIDNDFVSDLSVGEKKPFEIDKFISHLNGDLDHYKIFACDTW